MASDPETTGEMVLVLDGESRLKYRPEKDVK